MLSARRIIRIFQRGRVCCASWDATRKQLILMGKKTSQQCDRMLLPRSIEA
jgi:hypothetical protein